MRFRTHWFIATRRAHNRWLDLRGRLSGYCMATTWRENTGDGPGYSPGYNHWRCWRQRGHLSPHRFNSYVWDDSDDGGVYDPLPVRTADSAPAWLDGRKHGVPPPWGKHNPITPRRETRRMALYAERARAVRYHPAGGQRDSHRLPREDWNR